MNIPSVIAVGMTLNLGLTACASPSLHPALVVDATDAISRKPVITPERCPTWSTAAPLFHFGHPAPSLDSSFASNGC